MPSPPLPRATSDPTVPRTRRRSRSQVPPSGRVSHRSSWSKKFGKLIAKKNEWSKNSDLTEESLNEHNRRHAHLDEKNYKSSPYYKGLTDSSLIINRKKFPASPGRESRATTGDDTSSSSLSSFIAKMQEWSSLLTFTGSKAREITGTRTAVKGCGAMKKSSATAVEIERREVRVRSGAREREKSLLVKEKPLRERTLKPAAAAAVMVAAPILICNRVVGNDEKDENRRFVWANKYRPKTLKDFICNRDKANQLEELVRAGACGHFIFEGGAGVGKRTMIWAMLREAYGADRIQARDECIVFALKGEAVRSIQINVRESSQHVEVNLSEMKGYEKHVVVELIKETRGRKSDKTLETNDLDCRAIILHEADTLSTDALLYIRWLLERYKGCNKVFFCCSDISKLEPIKSICTVIELLPPSNTEIVEVLEFIAEQEAIELPHSLAEKIADNSKNNLRQAIRSFEASWKKSYPFKEDQAVMTGWEDDIANITKNLVEEQSPKQLYIIRGKLQNLKEHNVSPEYIFEYMLGEVKKQMNEKLHSQIDCLYKEYNLEDGSPFDSEKPFFGCNRNKESARTIKDPLKKNVVHQFLRIEEFIAKFMSWYKISVANNKKREHMIQLSEGDFLMKK